MRRAADSHTSVGDKRLEEVGDYELFSASAFLWLLFCGTNRTVADPEEKKSSTTPCVTLATSEGVLMALKPRRVEEYHVFLASPGDMNLERQEVRRFFDESGTEEECGWTLRGKAGQALLALLLGA